MKADEDKLYEIQALVRDVPLKDHIYLDPESSAFLVCEHELEILKGSYAKDPTGVLENVVRERSQGTTCASTSGERISAVIQDQDQFDEMGGEIARDVSWGDGARQKTHMDM